ncbi:hypothetical protein GCM10028803_41840 [Larkinella knui]|uniref:Lipocalin-like domain-containing protein n=1 Tax=Larkinella knui TaxID=2025310 RepID=A0A3P1CPD0_9BACT|nr:hypothetical protein [Larkinella knui]RRB14814.1 hypothetical protein EHT87_09605 [Larkinella knui]
MKNVLILLLALVTFASCKKDSEKGEVTPKDPATAVAGTYKLSSFAYEVNGKSVVTYKTLPVTQQGVTVSATAEMEKTSDGTVSLVLLLKATGEDDQQLDLGEYEVKANGANYGLFSDGGSQIAEIKAGKLVFEASGTSEDGSVEIRFEGKK